MDGIDEFMAQLTTVEAAFGLQDDHEPDNRCNYRRLDVTKRVARRLAAAMKMLLLPTFTTTFSILEVLSFMAEAE